MGSFQFLFLALQKELHLVETLCQSPHLIGGAPVDVVSRAKPAGGLDCGCQTCQRTNDHDPVAENGSAEHGQDSDDENGYERKLDLMQAREPIGNRDVDRQSADFTRSLQGSIDHRLAARFESIEFWRSGNGLEDVELACGVIDLNSVDHLIKQHHLRDLADAVQIQVP
ncbi:hypothetical protein D3C73_730720 [compost metagenome]